VFRMSRSFIKQHRGQATTPRSAFGSLGRAKKRRARAPNLAHLRIG
jgi:hypothetical protein